MASVQEQVWSGPDPRLVLRSRLGAITLALLCAVQFLDIADSAIVNVALSHTAWKTERHVDDIPTRP